jgi:hypothetical protein
VSRLLLVGVFFEIGLVLVFVPWISYWEHNYFAELLPALGEIMADPYLRGAVSGLGILNLYAAFAELGALLSAGQAEAQPAVPSTPPVPEE